MKKIKSNLWIDNDETYVQSYNTKVATIEHTAQTVTALGWWSLTTQRHIKTIAKMFGYRDIDNFRRIWYSPPKRVSQPQPSMTRGYLDAVDKLKGSRYTYNAAGMLREMRDTWIYFMDNPTNLRRMFDEQEA